MCVCTIYISYTLNDNNCDVGLCDDDEGGGRILTDITDSTGGTERMSPSASVC